MTKVTFATVIGLLVLIALVTLSSTVRLWWHRRKS